MKKYNIILADPPWSYKDKNANGKRGVAFKYPTLKIKDIQNIPVQWIAEEQSVLFLWVTGPLIQEGLDTIKAWSFKFKTFGFTWIKTNQTIYTKKDISERKDKSNIIKCRVQDKGFVFKSIHIGLGHYTRANAEFCLIGTRGKLFDRDDEGVPSAVVSDRYLKHSKKPPIVIERINKLYGPDLSRIELFAREKPEGWDATGLDLGGEGKGEDIREFLSKYEVGRV